MQRRSRYDYGGHTASGYARRMLLSDRDLRAEIAAGRLVIDPYDDALVQPSSVDVRLDRFFRVFNNTRYTHIDPAQQQDELTSLVEPLDGEPFVLHPGEFVLGSTLELCTLPDDLAGRLEDRGLHRPRLYRPHHFGAVQRRQPADHVVAGHENRPALYLEIDQPGGASLRQYPGSVEISGPTRPHAVALVRELHQIQLTELGGAARWVWRERVVASAGPSCPEARGRR